MKFFNFLTQHMMTHDDLVDAVAYIDQLAQVAYAGNWEEFDDYEELDSLAGY